MNQNTLKQSAAIAAFEYFKKNFLSKTSVIGIGTGSTVNYFIDQLASVKHQLEAVVSSSNATTERLKLVGIRVESLNSVPKVDVYIDGADEVNQRGQMIKGGGGALTSEKIIATCARNFICVVDESKVVHMLGKFPVAVEVIPSARSSVAREIVRLGGDPEYREGFVTDHGNVILDVHNFNILNADQLERDLNNMAGVVCNGIFANRCADVVIVAGKGGVRVELV